MKYRGTSAIFNRLLARDLQEYRYSDVEWIWIVEAGRRATPDEIRQLCSRKMEGYRVRRIRPDPKSFDLTHPCPICGYRIPPSELRHVDGENIKCPKCGQLSPYVNQKPKEG